MQNPVTMRGAKFLNNCGWAIVIGTPLAAGFLSFTPPTSAQEVKSGPIFENVTLSPNFSPDPRTLRGISGGAVPASKVAGRAETATGSCMGFVDEKADHKVVLTSFFKNLSIQVESPQDTTIAIKGPGGVWCNDDYQGKNPGISGQWLPGSYQIWVGSYQKNKETPYIIRISEGR